MVDETDEAIWIAPIERRVMLCPDEKVEEGGEGEEEKEGGQGERHPSDLIPLREYEIEKAGQIEEEGGTVADAEADSKQSHQEMAFTA